MEECKVSVVVPVYNAEAYLAACIESLLNQTLRQCEFIFVNDGSTDNSGSVLERYRLTDERIIVLHQRNQGVSIARNAGIRLAQGTYIGFVDADDHVERDMFETLYLAAGEDDCDVVFSNLQSETGSHKITTTYPFPADVILDRSYIREHILPFFLHSDQFNTAANKLYRLQVIKENGVTFPRHVALGEDGMFNMRFFVHAAKGKYIDYTGYHYREVQGSATRNIKDKDYFTRALEVYRMELPDDFIRQVDRQKMIEYRSVKLIQSVMSYIHLYFSPSKDMSFMDRFRYVRRMIRHEEVEKALRIYGKARMESVGRYDRAVLQLIRRKLVLGLFCVAAYSRLRNNRLGGSFD